VTRREQIVFLLEHLRDCCGPGGSGGGRGDSDGSIGFALTSAMADHPSVIELGRCLDLLRRMAPAHARDLEAYFGSHYYVDWVPVTVKRGNRWVRVLDKDGQPSKRPVRRRSLPAWLACVPMDRETGEPQTVARGVDFISGTFRGEPFVPKQLLAA